MQTATTSYGKSSDFDAFAISLHQCLKRHKPVLEKEGLTPELRTLVRWTDQVYSGSMTALEMLEQSGPEYLHKLRDGLQNALEEQQRAVEEFPEPVKEGEKQQHQYADACRDVASAIDAFLEAVSNKDISQVTETDKTGEAPVQLVTPQDDGQITEVGIETKMRSEVATALGSMLASTYSLYVKALFYHWNVTGPQFHGLHTLFEEHYENLHSAGDEIAERIRALGHFTPGTLRSFAALSVVKDDEYLPENAEGMLKNLRVAHELCAGEARQVLEVAERAGDEVTADMMVERMRFHDEANWMLNASLSQ